MGSERTKPLCLSHVLIVLAGGAAGGCFLSELAGLPEMGRHILTPSTQEALPDWPLPLWATIGAIVAIVLWCLAARRRAGVTKTDYAEALRLDSFSFLPLWAFYLLYLVYIRRELAPELAYYPFFLIPLALACSLAWKLAISPASEGASPRVNWWLGLGTGTFVAVLTTLNSLQIRSANVPFTDSGYFERMLWNICHGNLLHCCEHEHIFLGTRVRFVQFLLVPLYALWPSLHTLAFVQTLAIGLGAVPVYLLSKRALGDDRLALACAAGYLLHPATQFLASDASGEIVRLGTLGMPVSLLALYWIERRRYAPACAAFAFALLCREEYALVLAAAGVLVLAQRRSARKPTMRRRQRNVGLAFLALGLGWFGISLFVVIPHFRTSGFGGFGYYEGLGGSGTGIVTTLATRPGYVLRLMFTPAKVGFLLHLVVPLCLAPILAPGRLLLALPLVVICLLSSRDHVASILFHYHAPALPFLFLALPYGLRVARAWLNDRAHSAPACSRGLTWAVVTASLIASILAGKSPISLSFYDRQSSYHYGNLYARTERSIEATRVVRSIPRQASVCATEHLATQFTHHANCWTFPDHIESADFVVIDQHDRWLRGNDDVNRQLQQLLATPHWQPLSNRQGVLVLRRAQRRSSTSD